LKNKIKTFLKFVIPLGIWCFLFYPIFSQQALISSETLHIYSVVKFYIDNLKLGVFPLWDPFVMWGESTQIFLNYAGIFNPFWLLILPLNALGLSFYQSFLCVVSLYFWIGQLGFYLLAKTILKNNRVAYAAFLLFLFSSASLSVFAQFHPPLLYIPGIWFFYFLFSFLQKPSGLSWTGLILTVSIVLTSYLPFYFLTVFIIVMLLMVVFYFPTVKAVVGSAGRFGKTHFAQVVLAGGVVVLSFIPGYLAYQSTAQQQIVAPFRNEDVSKNAGVYFNNYEKIDKNGFAGRMDLEDLYSNFDLVQYGDDCFFYVSLFFYIVLIAAVFLRLNKVIAVCGLTAVTLFFLIIESGSGFHRFLFEHVVYFRLIRNMHFFLAFFLGALVLLVAEQLRLFFNEQNSLIGKKRRWFLFFIVLVHAGVGVFLLQHQYIFISSCWTLGISLMFWIVFVFDHQGRTKLVLAGLLFLSITVEPFEMIWRHNQSGIRETSYANKAFIKKSVSIPSVKPVFVYTRPVSSMVVGNDDTAYWRIAMKDASRFFENGFPTFWSYQLTLKVPFDDLQKYTANKFYIYDAVDVLRNIENFQDLANSFRTERNVAFVAPGESVEQLSGLMTKIPEALLKPVSIVRGASEVFKVLSFDVNSIKIQTHFPDEKFLVYTDSYHKDWKALINGKPAVIYRANMAFKGIYLPPGVNEIYFQYMPMGVFFISVLLVIVLLFLLIYLLWLRIKEK